MTDNELLSSKSEPTPEADSQQGSPLDATIGGSINGQIKAAIRDAFGAYGWDQSSGVRTVLTAWLESAQVRDAVVKHIHQRAAA